MNANYFSVPKETYESLGRGKVWQMNKKFLNDAMERGDRIVLSHKPVKGVFTGFGREVAHLKKSGYKEIYTTSGRKIDLWIETN